MSNYLSETFQSQKNPTPQTLPIPGKPMVQNSAGGYAFQLGDRQQLRRFLILGCEGGTYYATERELALQNAAVAKRMAEAGDLGLVQEIVAVSEAGRAPKNDPALFALAVAVKHGTPVVRAAALAALPKVARIGTHLLHFAEFCKQLDVGWGRAVRRAFGKWYTGRSAASLARQLVKYQQRDGWSNRDVLRLSHPLPPTPEHQALLHWAVKGEGEGKQWPENSPVIHAAAFEKLKKSTSPAEAAQIIVVHDMPREAVPTELLNSPEVWRALLAGMKPEAMIRNLGKMTSIGLLSPLSQESRLVCDAIHDPDAIKAARLHPIKVLAALLTYKQGHGTKGKLTWTPDPNIVAALDDAFYLAFGALEPTGKRVLKALDVSGSMDGGVVGGVEGLTPRLAASTLAMVSARVEKSAYFVGFTSAGGVYDPFNRFRRTSGWQQGVTPLALNARMSLDDVCSYMRGIPFGGTDAALPIMHALQNRIPVDLFEVYTDNETYAGSIHPKQALDRYRREMGINAKLVVVAMTSTGFTIADPSDAGMLDVVGFDTATPQLISDFSMEG